MTNRRDFLKQACAAAALTGVPARIWGAAKMLDKPDLVIGLLSDIHIAVRAKTDPVKATAMFRHALEYFRDRHVDGVLVSGDLADAGLESELKAVADAWFAVFPDGKLPDGSPVANLMHYGDHDAEHRFYNDRLKEGFIKAGEPVPRSLSENEHRKEVWEACFREPWSPLRHVRVKGYDFVLSNFMREGGRSAPCDLEQQLRAMNLDPAKPFFFSQHRYIGTTYRSKEEMWGGDNGVTEKVMPKFPNAVVFQGHTHYMLTDDCGVWIGPFIAINNGSLLNQAPGRQRENGVDISWYRTDYMRETQMRCLNERQAHGGMVMTLKGDVAVLERRDFASDLPLGPDLVFSVSPAKRARFTDAARKAASIAPEFPAGAKVTVSERKGKDRRGRPTDQVVVTFPTVRSSGKRPRAYDYIVRAEKADGTLVKEKRVFSPCINCPEEKEPAESTCVFSKAETAGATVYGVRPANCWNVAGAEIRG